MNIRFKARRRQSGAALVVLLALVVLVSAAFLLSRFDSEASISVDRGKADSGALADAKAALIAWSATYAPSAVRESAPGTLPFPDRNGDGDYDGMSDCDALGASDLALVGRLPQLGENAASCLVNNPLNVDFRDGDGEPLWYAVSRNVLPGVGVGGGPINPDMGGAGRMAYPWIQLRDAQGAIINDPNTGAPLAVAAVIFAPGRVIGAQTRGGAAAPANYLDRVDIVGTTYDNADSDGCPDNLTAPCVGFELEEFVVNPNPQSADAFNDKLVYITVDELMRAVEKRVLGETALALDAYRAAGWNTGNVYPWLAQFENPRAGSSGIADGGSTTQLTDAGANFVADGIQSGDVLINTTNGDSALVTAVAATAINFNSLLGGADTDIDSGDNYQIQVPFKSALARSGQIPVHLPNEIFHTTFTANWDLDDIDDYNSGDPTLYPSVSETETNNIAVTNVDDGKCMWTEADRVDCYGIQTINPFEVNPGDWGYRVIEVSFSFTGRNGTVLDSATMVPPTATEPRRRDVRIDVDFDGAGDPQIESPIVQAAPLLPQYLWVVKITDYFAGNSGSTRLEPDLDTEGFIQINGIRYDMSIVYDNIDDAKDELPEWFGENNWHHFIYAAFSSDVVAGGDGDCLNPLPSTCLTLNVEGTVSEPGLSALLISPGASWATQDRGIGDCDGDSIINAANDSYLCAYFDSDTTLGGYNVSIDILRHGADAVTLTQPITADEFSRDVFSNVFNDQIRVIQ